MFATWEMNSAESDIPITATAKIIPSKTQECQWTDLYLKLTDQRFAVRPHILME